MNLQNEAFMKCRIQNHFLEGARQVLSPNYSEREDPSDISLLVIHNISLPPGKFGNGFVDQLFLNKLNPTSDPYFESIASLRVSAHILIARDGLVTQYVPFNQKAWHAGESSFEGRVNCNEFSIGIELEGTDDTEYTEEQYHRLTEVTQALLLEYPKINRERIIGHSSLAPDRKTDPGPSFNWDAYLHALEDL